MAPGGDALKVTQAARAGSTFVVGPKIVEEMHRWFRKHTPLAVQLPSRGAIIQSTFSSWQDLGENYLIGREFWSYAKTLENGNLMWAAYDRLLANPESPWNRIPWDLNLR